MLCFLIILSIRLSDPERAFITNRFPRLMRCTLMKSLPLFPLYNIHNHNSLQLAIAQLIVPLHFFVILHLLPPRVCRYVKYPVITVETLFFPNTVVDILKRCGDQISLPLPTLLSHHPTAHFLCAPATKHTTPLHQFPAAPPHTLSYSPPTVDKHTKLFSSSCS